MSTDTMQAIRFHEYGDADKLVLDRVPRPEVQPQTLLVRVHAAGGSTHMTGRCALAPTRSGCP
jgi:hypothetical protein